MYIVHYTCVVPIFACTCECTCVPLVDESCDFNYRQFAHAIYQAAFKRLEAADIDQEVKERAITCM